MAQKINIDKLAVEVYDRLMQYQKVTLDVMENAVENTAKLTAMDINERAAEKFDGNKYSRSWSYKKDGSIKGRWAYAMVVYSKNHITVLHICLNTDMPKSQAAALKDESTYRHRRKWLKKCWKLILSKG